jgi:hypothetical protein
MPRWPTRLALTARGMKASPSGEATHLAIGRLAAGPDVARRSNQKHAPILRGSLWESDRGADKVAFGKLDAAMTQNIVSGGVMKIEVGKAEIQ